MLAYLSKKLQKNYEKIVKSAGKIPLIIAGDGEISKLRTLLQEKSLLGNVEFPGWIRGEQKEKLLQESTYFLFPSYNEGMPMAVLEAMAYGMGIVAGNVGGIPKLIEDGKSGYLCTPGDTDGISEKMLRLILGDEHCGKCGQNARKTAMDKFSYEAHIRKLASLYDEL